MGSRFEILSEMMLLTLWETTASGGYRGYELEECKGMRVRFLNQLVVCLKTMVAVITTADGKLKQRIKGDWIL